MLGHKMFQVLRERITGTFCTVREDVRQPPFDRVELLQGKDVVPDVDVTDFPALESTLSACGQLRGRDQATGGSRFPDS